jgi:hypothetical protein
MRRVYSERAVFDVATEREEEVGIAKLYQTRPVETSPTSSDSLWTSKNTIQKDRSKILRGQRRAMESEGHTRTIELDLRCRVKALR